MIADFCIVLSVDCFQFVFVFYFCGHRFEGIESLVSGRDYKSRRKYESIGSGVSQFESIAVFDVRHPMSPVFTSMDSF